MLKEQDIYNPNSNRELTERESNILNKIIQLYILKASPIGSRFLAKITKDELNLSPASLRNIMSDLEELEYISHPHTSAGRVPTDKGYRFYVDNLNEMYDTSFKEFDELRKNLNLTETDKENFFHQASKLLGMLSRYLGVVKLPQISDLIVLSLELISISSNRLLAVLVLDSNIVKTVTIEVEFEYKQKDLEKLKSYINEKISGKSLKFIRNNFNDIIKDMNIKETPLIRLFTDSIEKIFNNPSNDKILISGTQNLFNYPEFENLSRVKGVIELIENRDVIIHLLDKTEVQKDSDIQVLIGSEMESDLLEDFSFVTTSYKFGSTMGSIGLIGPKRMNYPKMISLVHTVSLALTLNLEQ